ncbi:MAG: hypothetical protein LBJ96_04125 [Holosporaceae bacterium]|jgi:hypothetical protein|nr:hypothetical protein [Holosporaceae bacterium]
MRKNFFYAIGLFTSVCAIENAFSMKLLSKSGQEKQLPFAHPDLHVLTRDHIAEAIRYTRILDLSFEERERYMRPFFSRLSRTPPPLILLSGMFQE